jgi:hypothetical protein
MSPKLENLSLWTAMLNFLITSLVFWNVTPYSQIDRDQHFEGTWCLSFYPDDEASTFSKILVTLYQSTWHHSPKTVSILLIYIHVF